jgi:hypothetical protein
MRTLVKFPAALASVVLAAPAAALAGVVLAVPAASAAASPAPACANGKCTVTFPETGAPAAWTVPAGVPKAVITLYGGSGGTDNSVAGGLGARASGTVTLAAGTSLTVNVGGAGGNGGGGTSAPGGYGGGGQGGLGSGGGTNAAGGGATMVSDSAGTLLVAGGGGGAGYLWDASGGSAGGNADTAGQDGHAFTEQFGDTLGGGGGGGAGTQNVGGAGGTAGTVTPVPGSGICNDSGKNGAAGAAGSAAQGGGGGSGGGGGGGGYSGGGEGGGGSTGACGGSGNGGGGGGSSYAATDVSNVSVDDAPSPPAALNGNGEAVISYTDPTATGPAFVQDSPPLTATAGQAYSYTFTASGNPAPSYALAPGAPSWLAVNAGTGTVTGTPPAGTGSFGYEVTAGNLVGTATAGPFTVTVTPPPVKADLSAALSCPHQLSVTAKGSCTLTVSNHGPAAARSLTAVAALPGSLAEVSCTGGCARRGTLLTWQQATLAAGTAAHYTITVKATRAGQTLVLAVATSRSPDPDPFNNVTAAVISIRQ